MRTTITRRFEFDSGHRVLGHESKCANLHGHRYVADVTVTAGCLDSISRIIDFSVIKKVIGDWIDEFWDHNMLLNAEDPLVDATRLLNKQNPGPWKEKIYGNKLPYIMPAGMNPTAEVMASHLFAVAEQLLSPYNIQVKSVRIYETPNCWSDYPV